MKRFGLLFCFAFGMREIVAQTNQSVFPAGFESVDGNSGDPLFEGNFTLQQIFRNSSLGGTWTGPVLITDLAFRVTDGAAASFSAVIPKVEIRLSTTARTPETMTTSWVSNQGLDAQTVFLHNNVPLFAAADQSVNPFDLHFHFDSPFLYDPSLGNLAMYVEATAGGVPGTRSIDSHHYASFGVSPVGAVSRNTLVPAPYGVVTEFSWVVIPEAAPWSLFMIGATVLIGCVTKRRS